MPQDDCLDVLGWELPRALDEFRALGIPVSVIHTCSPKKTAKPDATAQSSSDEVAPIRVVAVRPRYGGGCLLIACAEVW